MPEEQSKSPPEERKLSPDQRELVRDFLWRSIVPPAILVSILTALGGYVLRGFQDAHFLTQLSDKVIQFSESTGNASARLGLAQKQADDFLLRIQTLDEQSQKLAAELKGVSPLTQLKDDRTAIITALTNDPSFKTELAKLSSSSWDPAKQIGFLVVGDTLICYATASLQYKGSGHTCPFEFAFPKEFAAAPAISQSVRVEGSGYTYGVYRHMLTATGYTGILTEVQGRDNNNPVTMSYVAIGKAK